MQPWMARMLDECLVPVNKEVFQGLATAHLERSDQWLVNMLNTVAKGFPAGLSLVSYDICTPQQEYLETTRERSGKRTFDISESYVRMANITLDYEGHSIVKHIFRAFADRHNFTVLNSAKFQFVPVLTDKVITASDNNIFCRLMADKLNFRRELHGISVDGLRKNINLCYSRLHHKRDSTGNKVLRTVTTNVAYLFARFGVRETFRKYCGCEILFGLWREGDKSYPKKEDWVVIGSSQLRPSTLVSKIYTPSYLKLAIPREVYMRENDNTAELLAGGFFHMVDHFTDRIRIDSVENDYIWRVALGYILFGDTYSENKLYSTITEHIEDKTRSLDDESKARLAEVNVFVDDFYDLLAHLMRDFNRYMMRTDSSSISMFGKSVVVSYFVYYDVLKMFNIANFALNKPSTKIGEARVKEITTILNNSIRAREIFKVKNAKIVTESVSYPGDNGWVCWGTKVNEQETSAGADRRSKAATTIGPDKYFDPSFAIAGQALYLDKPKPSPHFRISPFVNMCQRTATILPDPRYSEILSDLQRKLKGR